jgi:O-antigen/teichoic acid export membrane protein
MVPVAMSHFAKEARESRDAARPFLVGVSYITALSWSFAAGIALLAHPIIRLLYGPQWDASVDVARLLGLAMAFAAILPLCLAVLVGTGQAVRLLQATALCAASTLALVWIGSRYGLIALGVALVIDAAIGATVWLAFTRHVLHFEWRDLWHRLTRSFAVAAIAAVGPALACLSYGPYPEELAMPLFIGTAGGVLGLLAGLRMTGHPLDAEVRKLLPRLRGMLGTGGAGSGQ